jgi:AcrR family transcriptional regulator
MEGKVDHRTKITKMLIKKAFTDLLMEKPIQKISIKELCEKAGINRGTFYLHYTDIFDLLEKTETQLLIEFKAALYPMLAAEGSDITSLKITKSTFQCIKDNADICIVTLGPNGDKEFAEKIIDIGWQKCLDEYNRLLPHESSKKLEYYYSFISLGCLGILDKWFNDGMSTSIDELATLTEGFMMQGIKQLFEE